jgi:GT2 family glycosyltransferase
MTSLFTTGGIRGNKKHVGTFHPRSFNMGISKEVYAETQGYLITRMGEDIEFSIRVIDNGFNTGLIDEAFVYHKRRTNFAQFYKQLHFFGRARINISRFFPKELKLVHTFPAVFTLGLVIMPLTYFIDYRLSLIGVLTYSLFAIVNFLTATFQNKNIVVGVLGVFASFIQLTAYGIGFITEATRKLFDS